MTITLTTTENQKNQNNENINTTLIILGDCEDLLRQTYNISEDQKIFMKKIDIVQEGYEIPYIKYDVYSRINGSNNLIKLNLSVCENTKIDIIIPIIISENLDKLNTSSAYFNDICYKTNSDYGTDIILKDRKEEFIKENKTICQDGCDFSNYNNIYKIAKCSCEVKESPDNYEDMLINKEKLFKNFIDIKNIANINLLKCYKFLFSKKGFRHNIGSFFIITIIIFHNICIFIFYKYQLDKVKDKITDIMLNIKNLKIYKKIKKRKRGKGNFKGDKNILKLNLKNIKNCSNPPNKKKKIRNIVINNKKNININGNNIYSPNSKEQIISKKEKKNEKSKEIIRKNEQELNDLNYEFALKCDNRSYFEYYFSLIKTKHELIFTFCYNKDYNSRIIKIDLFFINFVMNYTINALFFNDDTMHKIYEEKGKFQFLYQLPQIIYSSIISQILNSLFQLLALSEDLIIDFKNNINISNADERKIKLIKILLIKSILYYIIGTVFLFIFWFYISLFCYIYENTQIHLLSDTLISFGFSLLYPFGIYLLPGIFRIPALSNGKKDNKLNIKGKYLYNFSKFLQIF